MTTTLAATRAGELRFEPPGPGSWEIDGTHHPRPAPRFYTEIQPEPLAAGFRETTRRYGLLLDHLEFRWVNGFAYFAPRLVPDAEIPERAKLAELAFERRLWREDLRRWDERVKPASIRAHLALQAIDPEALSTDGLLEHLDRCREHLRRMIFQHHRFNAPAMVPVGDFVVHGLEWTGLPRVELLDLLSGAAPASAGASAELERLAQLIGENARNRAVLDGDGDPGDSLAALRSLPGELGQAASRYVSMVGYRPLDGIEIGDHFALELPELLLAAIRAAADADPRRRASGPDGAKAARVRAHVPKQRRAMFDELLTEARLTNRLRDERGVFSDAWAAGIARRAILAAGARLADGGRIDAPAQLIEAGYAEMRSLLASGEGPSAAELAERAAYRTSHRAADAPQRLGGETAPAPSLDGLAPAAARAMRAFRVVVGRRFEERLEPGDATIVRGLAASPGVYEGIARLIAAPAELGRLREGDVIVTHSTTEAFNLALPLLGAIVTNAGGLLSHPAIVAREYGIPAVVGCRAATEVIRDGSRVRVDGRAGTVRIL